MQRGFLAASVMAIMALVFVAGCGGGDDNSLTKAEFIQQGDAVCRKAEETKNKALEKAFAEENKGSEKEIQEKLVTDVALPPVAAMADELSELGPPDEQAEAVVSAYEEIVAEIEAKPETAFSTEEPFGKANKLAKQYGFKACSEI